MVAILAELNQQNLKRLLKTEIGLDKMDRLSIEIEVNSVDQKIDSIKRVYKFMRMIAVDSQAGKNYLRGVSHRSFTTGASFFDVQKESDISKGGIEPRDIINGLIYSYKDAMPTALESAFKFEAPSPHPDKKKNLKYQTTLHYQTEDKGFVDKEEKPFKSSSG